MLFAYTYVPHQMERMQRFINFIFYQVWCHAPKAGPYDLSLFDANPPLKEVMTTFAYDHTQEGDRFSSQVQAIYLSFSQLSRGEISQFKRWHQANNDIEKVCANDPAVQIARYTDIAATYPDLSEQLKSFFKGLYSQQLLDIKALREKIGKIDEHYQAFMQTNTTGKCPFCGLGDIKGLHHNKREAYDHYLPKTLYPFNTINFRNLAPACHECNSFYKLSRDPAHNAVGRRKAFYPYATGAHGIEITVGLHKPDIDHMTPDDIQLSFGPATAHEEIETWKEVYGIEERYKAKCCGSDAKDWLEQIRILHDTHDFPPKDSLAMVQLQTAKSPFSNCNFLKKAFLEGCQRVGLYDI